MFTTFSVKTRATLKRTCYSNSIRKRVQELSEQFTSYGLRWFQSITQRWIFRGSGIRESPWNKWTSGPERSQPWSLCANKNNKYTVCHIFLKDPISRLLKPFIIYFSRLQQYSCCCWKLPFKCVGRSYNILFKEASTNWLFTNVLERYKCDFTLCKITKKRTCWMLVPQIASNTTCG